MRADEARRILAALGVEHAAAAVVAAAPPLTAETRDRVVRILSAPVTSEAA